MKRLTFIIAVLFIFSIACGIFGSNTENSATKTPQTTDTQEVTATATQTEQVEATSAEVKISPTKTPEKEDTPSETDTANNGNTSNQMTESWRIPPYQGASLMAYDQTPNLSASLTQGMDKQARNLAIPSPYYFEIYQLIAGTKFGDLRDYYNKIITANGMIKGLDTMDYQGIGVVTWIDHSDKTRKYLVQYIPANSSHPPLYFILYSNPK
jgi:hypothetical protein